MSALADWGDHFCNEESPPGWRRRLDTSAPVFNQFEEAYPFCADLTRRRRLQVGGGTLNAGWAVLVRNWRSSRLPLGVVQPWYAALPTVTPVFAQDATASPNFSAEALVIGQRVDAFMCSVAPSKAGPQVRYEGILSQSWDLNFPECVITASARAMIPGSGADCTAVTWRLGSCLHRYSGESKWSKCWQEPTLEGDYTCVLSPYSLYVCSRLGP